MISLPFQNNTFFGVTKGDEEANVLNIQPVYPISAGDWNIITRAIVPIIYVPDPTDGTDEHLPNHDRPGDKFGLGDINFSAYFSPAKPARSSGASALRSRFQVRRTTSLDRKSGAPDRPLWR
jgi:hypothetical protein